MNGIIISHARSLARQDEMSMDEAVTVIAAYILCVKGVVLDLTRVRINDVTKFERMCTIASAYFLQEKFKKYDIGGWEFLKGESGEYIFTT